MKKILLIVSFLPFIGGCTASMVQMRNDENKSAYAPLNEKNGGTVKYQAGWNMTQKSDRERCYKKMYESCGGNYIITQEYENSSGSVSNTIPGSFVTSTATGHIVYRYLDFECAKKEN